MCIISVILVFAGQWRGEGERGQGSLQTRISIEEQNLHRQRERKKEIEGKAERREKKNEEIDTERKSNSTCSSYVP
jgi:hypothetical protein